MPLENSNKSRRLMHTRSITCEGFLRDDGLWEVEAWLRDTKPLHPTPASRFRGELKPGDLVHDIGLRLAIDETMTVREAGEHDGGRPIRPASTFEPILARLIGERIGPGLRKRSGARSPGPETCTHLMELLGPVVIYAVPDDVPRQDQPGGPRLAGGSAELRQEPVLRRRRPLGADGPVVLATSSADPAPGPSAARGPSPAARRAGSCRARGRACGGAGQSVAGSGGSSTPASCSVAIP